MKNKRGFTLIELLAVIVILAILILLAMPAVTNLMESSSRNTFKNEVLGIAKTMENAYTEKFGNGDVEPEISGNTKIHNITQGGKTYSYLCMTLQDMYDEQYIKKNFGDKYTGYVQMYVGEDSTQTIINITNGSYYIQGDLENISKDEYEPLKNQTDGYTITGTATCPESGENPESLADTLGYYLRGLSSSDTVIQDDGTIDKNMRYIGSNPNNYVRFNNELWRVIGVFNSNSHGQSKDLVKIIRNEYLDTMSPDEISDDTRDYGNTRDYSWDLNESGSSSNWSQSSLKNILNDGYFNSNSHYEHYRSSTYSWGDSYMTFSDFSSVGLSAAAKQMIQNVSWKVGKSNFNNDKKPSTIYNEERAGTSWDDPGYVAIPYMSDVLYASSGYSGGSRQDCLANPIYTGDDNQYWHIASYLGDSCSFNSWIFNSSFNSTYYDRFLTLTAAYSNYGDFMYVVGENFENSCGLIDVWDCFTNEGGMVFPTVYLKSGVKCTNCDSANVGSQSNPMQLTM